MPGQKKRREGKETTKDKKKREKFRKADCDGTGRREEKRKKHGLSLSGRRNWHKEKQLGSPPFWEGEV